MEEFIKLPVPENALLISQCATSHYWCLNYQLPDDSYKIFLIDLDTKKFWEIIREDNKHG